MKRTIDNDSGCPRRRQFYCDDETLERLKENNQIAFTYGGDINGSVSGIAGVVNEKGNVLGMMPHPERAVDELLGSADGLTLFRSIVKNWRKFMSLLLEPSKEQIKEEKLYQQMGVSDDEFALIESIIGRLPNYTEIGIFP